MANHNNFGMNEAGRARHSVRAVVCQAKGGAHGVTRPTFSVSEHECVNLIVECHTVIDGAQGDWGIIGAREPGGTPGSTRGTRVLHLGNARFPARGNAMVQ